MEYNGGMQANLEMLSTVQNVPFSVGDAVIYPGQGPGVIVGLTERLLAGKLGIYFEVELIKGATKLMIPIEKSHQILRPTITRLEIDKIIAELHINLDLPNLWPQRQRILQKILDGADIFELSSMVGTLWRRDQQKALSDSERRMLENAFGSVVSEMALVLDISRDEAKNQINKALGLIET